MRRPLFWTVGLLAALAVLWLKSPKPASESPAVTPANASAASPDSSLATGTQSTLAVELNATDSTVERDLIVVDSVLEAFRTNFPGDGNPVGENNEITAVLTGRNRLGLQLIPRGHPAINHRGELVDRWGTPFFFHQLSRDVMEIRSAGPDKVMHTEDDAVLAP